MIIWQVLLLAALTVLLMFAAALLIQHSVSGAVKAVRVALNSEFKTETGRVNLVGMILLVIIIMSLHLEDTLANALAVQHPAPSEYRVLAPMTLFFLGFVGSVICVSLMERK